MFFCQVLSLATTAAGTATGRNISGFMPNLIPLQRSFAYYTTSCVYMYLIAQEFFKTQEVREL